MADTIKVDAVTLAGHAAWLKGKSSRYAVPIFATAQVQVVDGGLRIRRTDYNLFSEVIVPADGAQEGVIVVQVNAAQLAALTKGGKGDAVVSVDTTGLTVVVGSRTVTLPSAGDVDDFPKWLEFTPADEPAAVMDVATLKRGLTSVGHDDTLPMLTGVRFDDGNMVTTDRFRMSVITYADTGFTTLVQRQTLQPFAKGKGQVTVEHGHTGTETHSTEYVRVTSGDRSIMSPVLEADFPKWRHLMPADPPLAALVRRADLLDAVDPRGFQVRLQWRGDGTMVVSTFDRDMMGPSGTSASLEQTIAANVTVNPYGGPELPFLVAHNPAFLASILKGIESPNVEITATSPNKPVVYKSGADYHLLMPVRLP